MNRPTLRLSSCLIAGLLMWKLAVVGRAADKPAVQHDVTSSRGVVVSVSREASEVGIEVLRRGGHAVDAAVATAFALAVTHPAAGNIGGGGFMMVHDTSRCTTVCVEYRETAPGAATRDIYSKLNGTSRGHLSASVPGTVRGMALGHEQFGRCCWRDLVEPAVALAANGFSIDEPLAKSLNGWIKRLDPYPEARRVYSKPDGAPWQAGDRLVQPELAKTLRLIADGGPNAFYCGPIADQIVAEMQAGGGLISKADLACYRANLRRPIHGTYRGYDVFAPPPPSSGGIALVQMLNILEQFDLSAGRAVAPSPPAPPRRGEGGRGSAETTHLFIEAMRRAYFDRARYIGDPAFTGVPVDRLTSKSYARELAAGLDRQRATRSDELGRELLTPTEGPSTTHFSVVDADGNAVANTYTLQDSYGSHVVVRGTGFLLNNEMTDFNLQPGMTDRNGRIGTAANLVEPGKRMLSSQTPTLVMKEGRVVLVTGTPGGRTIINTVLGVVTNVIDFGMTVRQAVDAPRLHHQWLPDVAKLEPGRVSSDTHRELESRGHKLDDKHKQGDAHSIWIDPGTGLRHGAADKRISGHAVAE
jgi:gamma-glutamyltranspeptidase/glutathione hydrolase